MAVGSSGRRMTKVGEVFKTEGHFIDASGAHLTHRCSVYGALDRMFGRGQLDWFGEMFGKSRRTAFGNIGFHSVTTERYAGQGEIPFEHAHQIMASTVGKFNVTDRECQTCLLLRAQALEQSSYSSNARSILPLSLTPEIPTPDSLVRVEILVLEVLFLSCERDLHVGNFDVGSRGLSRSGWTDGTCWPQRRRCCL